MTFGNEHLGHVSLRPVSQQRLWLAILKRWSRLPKLLQKRAMFVAGFHHFADRRRPLATALDARAWVADVGNHLVWVLLEHSPQLRLEAVRVGELVTPISGEYGLLAIQNERLPTVGGRQGLG